MPKYGIAQAGSQSGANMGLNLTGVAPGESFVLLSTSDDVTTGTPASVAFMPITGPDNLRSGITFTIDWTATPTGSTVLIQGSNLDIDGDYQTLYTSTATAHDSYNDVGGFLFYRAKVSVYSAGTSVQVIAKR